MPQARILINSSPTSNDDVAINVLVQLDNQSLGDETTYTWALLDQPPGTTDALSSTTIKNPSFTPKKEGTYLIKVTIDLGLATEQSDTKIVAVRQVKTRERIPAAGETTQDDSSDGWATAMNSLLRRIDALLTDPGIIVGVAGGTGLSRGSILKAQGGYTIKSGLPGQETVPQFTLSTALTLGSVDELLCAMEGDVSTGGTPSLNALCKARYIGRLSNVLVSGGAGGSPGDIIYLDDTGRPSRTQGTIRRQIGSIMTDLTGGYYDIWFDGVGGADITPISVGYILYGAPGAGMTGAKRIDGSNATGSSAGVPFTFISGDNATQSLVARAKSGQTAYVFQAQNSAGSNGAGFDVNGNLAFPSVSFYAAWPDQQIGEVSASPTRFQIGAPATNAKTFQVQTLSNFGGAEVWGDLSGTVRTAMQSDVTGTRGLIGTISNHALNFMTNNVAVWFLDPTNGDLHANLNRKIIWGTNWATYEDSGAWKIYNVPTGKLAAGVLAISTRTLFEIASLDTPTVAGYLDADPGTGRFGIASASNTPMQLGANSIYYWLIDSAGDSRSGPGNLVAQTLTQQIRGLQDPDPTWLSENEVVTMRWLNVVLKGRAYHQKFTSGLPSVGLPNNWASPAKGYLSDSAWVSKNGAVYDTTDYPGYTGYGVNSPTSPSTNHSMSYDFYLMESGRVYFSWRVLSGASDLLHVYIDGNEVVRAGGFYTGPLARNGGLYMSALLTPGPHRIVWRYTRSSGTVAPGESVAITDVTVAGEADLRAESKRIAWLDENWVYGIDLTDDWALTQSNGTVSPGQVWGDNATGIILSCSASSAPYYAQIAMAGNNINVPPATFNSSSNPGVATMLEWTSQWLNTSPITTGDFTAEVGFKYIGGSDAVKVFFELAGDQTTTLRQIDYYGTIRDVITYFTDFANWHTYCLTVSPAGVCLTIDGVAFNGSTCWSIAHDACNTGPLRTNSRLYFRVDSVTGESGGSSSRLNLLGFSFRSSTAGPTL